MNSARSSYISASILARFISVISTFDFSLAFTCPADFDRREKTRDLASCKQASKAGQGIYIRSTQTDICQQPASPLHKENHWTKRSFGEFSPREAVWADQDESFVYILWLFFYISEPRAFFFCFGKEILLPGIKYLTSSVDLFCGFK